MLYLLCGYVAAYQMCLKRSFQKVEEWYLIQLHPFAMGNKPAFKFGWEIFMSVYVLNFYHRITIFLLKCLVVGKRNSDHLIFWHDVMILKMKAHMDPK